MSGKVKRFDGKEVEVTWVGGLCIGAGECGRSEGSLFESGRDPWCQPDLTTAEDTVDVITRCPAGALSYTRKDGGAGEQPAEENMVMVANNGPLYVKGELAIEGAPEEYKGVAFRAALCRCGASKNKPFCDNTHEKIDFRDRGAVGEKGAAEVDKGGKLEVNLAKNGPLLLRGNFSIVSGSGRVAWKGQKAALCRCGASKNKPFCDGAHKSIGFQSEDDGE